MSTIDYPKNPKDLHKTAVYSLKQKCSVLAALHMFRRRQKNPPKKRPRGGLGGWNEHLAGVVVTYLGEVSKPSVRSLRT